MNLVIRVRTGFGKFWKVMELKMLLSRTWRVLGKEIFNMTIEKFWIFVWKNSKYILKWMQLSVVLNTVHVMFVHFVVYNVKHSPPENYKIFPRAWGDIKYMRTVNFLPEIANRAGTQAEKFPEFPIVVSENLPE